MLDAETRLGVSAVYAPPQTMVLVTCIHISHQTSDIRHQNKEKAFL